MPPRRFAATGDPALKTFERAKLRAQVKRDAIRDGRGCEMPACVMPTRAIDWAAKRGPWSYVLDEIIGRHLGGSPVDPGNVRPAHHRCNAVAGARVTNAKRRARAQAVPESATANRW